MWKKAEKILITDKYLGKFIAEFGHCSIKKSKPEDYFEDLAASIVEQQLSGKVAKVIFGRVKNIAKEDSPTPLSPLTAKEILSVSDEALRCCGTSWSKVKYLKDLAEKVDRGLVKLREIDKLDDEEVIAELVKVKGIGRWTAEMFLMFTLTRSDVFPLDDLGIRKGMEKLLEKKLNKTEMLDFSLRWKPYRTVASWYIWRILDN